MVAVACKKAHKVGPKARSQGKPVGDSMIIDYLARINKQ
jgi:hypothetical protein